MRIGLLIAFCVIGMGCFAQSNVAMSDLEETASGLVFKSPVHGDLKVDMPNQEDYKVSVFNSYGEKQLYLEGVQESVMLELKAFEPGSYFVIMKSDTTSKAFKFRKV